MRLTRRRLLGGAAAGALAAAGIYELVDQLAGSPQRSAAAGVAPEQHLLDGLCGRRRLGRRGARAAAAPRGRHGDPPHRHERGRAPGSAGGARGGAARARRALRGDARRAGRDGGVGPPVLPPLCGGAGRKTSADRHARELGGRQARPGARERRALPERSARDDPRGERRRRPPAQRLARDDRRRLEGAVRRARRDVPRHEHPERLRRRRLRWLAKPPEAHGDGCRRSRRGSHSRHVAALPRVHVDAEGRSRATRRSRTSRRSATSICETAGTSSTARTCTSRTSSRTSRPGT